ncbi:hypothetical protein N7456_000482 [Penicillium angulare]|uniref:Uncharacterized protein n=1 Tax=Penicillium angulare TaxID=116970 RepID=A0A9W9KS97_9EURO|nr:hypothetical protein N7456_000482 [Penicillium angulare]
MNPGKDLHERGSGFGGDLWASVLTYASTEMKTIFGAPALCTGDMDTTGLMVTTGQGDDVPDKWEICYYDGDDTFTQADADAANCLVNLHFTQDDKCIDVKGSMCAPGYSGPLQNAQVSYIYGPYQITGAQSVSLQAAINAIVGKKYSNVIDGGISHTIEATLVADNGSGIVGVTLYFVGENDC